MKKSAGFFMTILSAIAAVVGVVAYIMNTRTNYFINLGVNTVVVACAVAAVVIQVVYLIASGKGHNLFVDLLAVLPPVLLIVAAITLVSTRINGIAAIMTFENNAQNMADLTSAIVGIAGCVVAALIGVIASFFDAAKVKEAK